MGALAAPVTSPVPPRIGHLGKVLFVRFLSTEQRHWRRRHESVYRAYLGGYGLGAWLRWKHSRPASDPLPPRRASAIASGLLTGLVTPF